MWGRSRQGPCRVPLETAFAPLVTALGISMEETARGVVRIANANMTNALRLVSTNKGYDPRDFALMAFGGGGAMHAVALAEELRIPRVIVPVNSSVFSAWGMLLTDLRRDYLRTRPLALSAETGPEITTIFNQMADQAEADYRREDGADSGTVKCDYFADMRYAGQEHTVKVPVQQSANGRFDFEKTELGFHAAHEKRFTYSLDVPVQIVNFHVVAKVTVDKPEIAKRAMTGKHLDDAILHTRQVDFDTHGIHEAMIYDGLALEPEMELYGPAVVQEPSTTLVISPGHRMTVDDYGNYHVYLNEGRN